MQLSVARRVERDSSGELLACALLGLGAGLAAGFVLSEVYGTGGHRRAGRLLGWRTRPVTHADAPARAREALRAHPSLAAEPIEVRARAGKIELRGWVASRAARSLAYRLVHSLAGLEVANHLLVRGEDDRGALRNESSRTA
jgi:hypothetical protein